jgi:hypothetical protein
MADNDSRIAWHRAQLKQNREELKALEGARLAGQPGKIRDVQKAIFELERKIAESEKCIGDHDRQTRRPLSTDFGSLKTVSWGNWSAQK